LDGYGTFPNCEEPAFLALPQLWPDIRRQASPVLPSGAAGRWADCGRLVVM